MGPAAADAPAAGARREEEHQDRSGHKVGMSGGGAGALRLLGS